MKWKEEVKDYNPTLEEIKTWLFEEMGFQDRVYTKKIHEKTMDKKKAIRNAACAKVLYLETLKKIKEASGQQSLF